MEGAGCQGEFQSYAYFSIAAYVPNEKEKKKNQ